MGDVAHHRSTCARGEGWKAFEFKGGIDGLEAEFWIFFQAERLRQLIWCPEPPEDRQWSDRTHGEAWLRKVTGVAPPYEYAWGNLEVKLDAHEGKPGVVMSVKDDSFEQGFTNVRAFHKSNKKFLNRWKEE